jgi:hypothetical protein
MKIRPEGAELLQEEGGADMSKLKVAFCIFAKAPKKYI